MLSFYAVEGWKVLVKKLAKFKHSVDNKNLATFSIDN